MVYRTGPSIFTKRTSHAARLRSWNWPGHSLRWSRDESISTQNFLIISIHNPLRGFTPCELSSYSQSRQGWNGVAKDLNLEAVHKGSTSWVFGSWKFWVPGWLFYCLEWWTTILKGGFTINIHKSSINGPFSIAYHSILYTKEPEGDGLLAAKISRSLNRDITKYDR